MSPSSLKVEIYFWSRDYRILFATVLFILAIGAGLAWRADAKALRTENAAWIPREFLKDGSPWKSLEEALGATGQNSGGKSNETDRADRIIYLLMALDAGSTPQEAAENRTRIGNLIAASKLSPARKQLFNAVWNSLSSVSGEPDATLLTLAYRQQLTTANYLSAWLYMRRAKFDRALHFLKREAAFPQSSRAREIEIALLREKNNYEALEKISRDARYAGEWPAKAEIDIAVFRHEWGRAAWHIFRNEWMEIDRDVAGLVLLSGAIWFAIWLQAIQVLEAPLPRAGFCLAAFVLGLLSIVPTLLMVYWSERDLGLVMGNGILEDLKFFILGVGPREEFCKWLAFLPLVPPLLRRDNRLEMLIAAGFVGLGFAVEENFQYFSQHVDAAYGRFLTANFLHVAMTGLVGLSFCETLMEPRRKWWLFPACFLGISLLHGAYDFFLSAESLPMLEPLGWIGFIALSLLFFKRLRQTRSLETNYLWIPASIVTGLAVLTAATLVHTSAATGFTEAVHLLSRQAISLGTMAYLLLWQAGNLRYDAQTS